MADKKKPLGMSDAEWAMSGEGNLGVSPELLGYQGPLPRPKPKQMVNRAKKSDKLIIIKKANGGMIDGVAIRGKTKGKTC